jgi:hypothetical protein
MLFVLTVLFRTVLLFIHTAGMQQLKILYIVIIMNEWVSTSIYFICRLFLWRCYPTRVMASSFLRFLDHTQRRTTVGRPPLDEWSARRRDLYLTTQHSQKTSMPPVVFEPTISAGERPQTYALYRVAAGTGSYVLVACKKDNFAFSFIRQELPCSEKFLC